MIHVVAYFAIIGVILVATLLVWWRGFKKLD